MKKHTILIAIIAFIFISTACSGDSSLSKEEVISELETKVSEVENYYTDAAISVVITDLSTDTIIQNSEATIVMDIIETTMESSSHTINDTETITHYIADGASYVQINDQPWEISPEHATTFNDSNALYKDIAQVLVDLKDETDVEMEETEDAYRFTFGGKSASIYKAFEEPYSLSLTGATPDEMEQDLTIIVDSETFFLKQVKNSFTVEKDGMKMKISIDQTYDQINEIDEIVIPQEVIDEANEEDSSGNEQSSAKSDVITHVEENMDRVENYHTDAILQIDIIDVTTNNNIDSSQALLDIDMIEETLESSGIITEDDFILNYYATTDAAYVQTNGQMWEDHTDQPEQFDHSNTLYKDVAQIIIDLKVEEDVQMEEKDGKYLFSFTGKSEAIYYAFETPYSLSLTGATPDEMEQDMTITIDAHTFFIDQVKNTFTVEKEGLELTILLDQTYEQINEIDAITIPQEVIDEAS